MQENPSMIARFRERQALEEEAAQRGLYDFAMVARHESINKRMEMGAERLLKLIEEGKHEEAQALMNTTWGLETPREQPQMLTRDALVQGLRRALEHTEETTLLLEHIYTLWDLLDTLVARFGVQTVRQIIETPSSLSAQSQDAAEHSSKERR